MQLTLLIPVAECIAFGLVVAGGYILISGPPVWRTWLAYSWVLAWLCWIILFGIARV